MSPGYVDSAPARPKRPKRSPAPKPAAPRRGDTPTQPSEPAQYDPFADDKVDEKEPGGAYLHDGFFLRMGLGGALLSTNVNHDFDLSGIAPALSVAIGGSPTAGFAMAGRFAMARSDSVASNAGNPSMPGVVPPPDSLSLAVYQLMLAGYPKPSGGFHLFGAIGWAVTRANDDSLKGFSGTAGTGWEGWVGKEWGLGGALSVTKASGANGDGMEISSWISALELTATFH